MTCKISGAWSIIRTCPYDGTESILGLYPEGKAALLKLEWFMDDPSNDEQYKLEYHVFESYEQLLEQHQRCKANRAEWDEKTKVYEEHKAREKMLAEYPDADEEEQEEEFDSILSDT